MLLLRGVGLVQEHYPSRWLKSSRLPPAIDSNRLCCFCCFFLPVPTHRTDRTIILSMKRDALSIVIQQEYMIPTEDLVKYNKDWPNVQRVDSNTK